MSQTSAPYYDKNQKDPKVGDLVKQLERKLDELAAVVPAKSETLKSITLLRALVIYLEEQMINMYDIYTITLEERKVHVRKLLKLVEPYGNKPEGVRFYVWAWRKIAWIELNAEHLQVAERAGLMVQEIYEKYGRDYKGVTPWNIANYIEFIGAKRTSMIKDWEESLARMMNKTSDVMSCIYSFGGNQEGELHHTIPVLKEMMTIKPGGFNGILLDRMLNFIALMLEMYCYKQADHLLAIGMHETVKERRRTSENDPNELDTIQGKLSLQFASWGEKIADNSMQKIKGEKGAPEPNDHFYIEMTELMGDNGYLTYAHQFPIELVNTEEEVKAVLKKAKVWHKRGAMLLKNNEKCECEKIYGSRLTECEEKNFHQ